ncbi:MAG: flavodoxin [Treponema sp.]|jgi:flavodoxin|nr:flavodoxin [Treponema sp.]
MKTAVIYYSYEGNSALIAEEIRNVLGADLFELKTEDDTKREGFSKYFWGGRQVLTGKSPALKPCGINVDPYELLIIGFPVWAGSPAPALNSFLGEREIRGKRIALFCCHGGGKGKALEKLKARLPGNTFAGEIDFRNPLQQDRGEVTARLRGWLEALTAPAN